MSRGQGNHAGDARGDCIRLVPRNNLPAADGDVTLVSSHEDHIGRLDTYKKCIEHQRIPGFKAAEVHGGRFDRYFRECRIRLEYESYSPRASCLQ